MTRESLTRSYSTVSTSTSHQQATNRSSQRSALAEQGLVENADARSILGEDLAIEAASSSSSSSLPQRAGDPISQIEEDEARLKESIAKENMRVQQKLSQLKSSRKPDLTRAPSSVLLRSISQRFSILTADSSASSLKESLPSVAPALGESNRRNRRATRRAMKDGWSSTPNEAKVDDEEEQKEVDVEYDMANLPPRTVEVERREPQRVHPTDTSSRDTKYARNRGEGGERGQPGAYAVRTQAPGRRSFLQRMRDMQLQRSRSQNNASPTRIRNSNLGASSQNNSATQRNVTVDLERSSSLKPIEAQIVVEAVEEDNWEVSYHSAVIAKKDSFFNLLRHDRKTQVMTTFFSASLIALIITLTVTLSRNSSPLRLSTFVQTGLNIQGPSREFPFGSGEDAMFGASISMNKDGTRIAIGAPEYTSSVDGTWFRGLIQIFGDVNGMTQEEPSSTKNTDFAPTNWTLLESILGESSGDMAGTSVALSLDGKYVVVGSPGHSIPISPNAELVQMAGKVQVYREDSQGKWVQIGQSIVGEDSNDKLGLSVAISQDGSRIAISLQGNNDRNSMGKARVYEYIESENEWFQLGDDLIGWLGRNPLSMSADGNVVVMGSVSTQENQYVAVVGAYEYKFGWKRMGSDIRLNGGIGYDTLFVPSLSSDGRTFAVGTEVLNVENIEYHLYVQVYRYKDEGNVGDWAKMGENLHDKKGNHLIAYTVSLSADGNVLAIGDPGGSKSGINSGHTHVLRNVNDGWVHTEKELEGFHPADLFGFSVSVSSNGKRVGVSSPQSRMSGSELGTVTVYETKALD